MSASKFPAPIVKFSVAAVLAIIALVGAAAARAQNAKQTAAAPFDAPFPPAIAAGKTVFLSNAGLSPDPRDRILSSGKAVTLPFSQFYQSMQSWARYQLVDSPSAADLVFEFSLTSNYSWCTDPQNCQAALVEVVIYDAKTHFRLWTFDEPIFKAMLNSNFTKNINQAMSEMMADLKSAAPNQ
jgi:hypothetical protein